MRIAFLLGAGVSIPAGMPSTEELTNAVLQVKGYRLHTDGSFVKASLLPIDDHWSHNESDLHRLLLETIRQHCQTYFKAEDKRRVVNYEDLFFAAGQLDEHLSQEYENPAIEPFAKAVLKNLRATIDREKLRELAETVCNYIRDVVFIELNKTSNSPDHLICLEEALRDQDFEGCDVFTLNHDILIEKTLERAKIPFVDGFEAPKGDVAYWNPEVFKQNSRHFVLKLHGSINWRRYSGHLAKTLTFDHDHAYSDGKMLDLPSRPILLVGTFNKIRGYVGTPYFDLQKKLRQQMDRTDCIVVSGYSFGDKGVNAVLSNWIEMSDRSKLVVLHANANECLTTARGAIRKVWERRRDTRMFIHPSHLSNSNWRELRGLII